VEWKGEWGTYRPAAKWPQAEGGRIEGHRVVDGGVLSNFPLKFLLSERHRSSEGVLGPLPGGREAQVLGLLLDEGKKGEGDAAERKKRFADRLPVYQSVSRLIDTMTSAWDKDAIEEYKAEPYVCHIGVKGVDTLDFNMSEGQVAALVKSGSSAMKEYLDNWKPAT
jgi:predicted acylesterase/phospholipase RssA